MTTPIFVFSNNATTTLAGPITNTATTANLATGSGALFPTLTAGEVFVLSLIDAATGLLHEICYCTAISGDTVTIERAQEGTTALNWLAGDIAANLVTAGTLAAFQQTQAGVVSSFNGRTGTVTLNNTDVTTAQGSQALNYYADTGAANAYVITASPAQTPAAGVVYSFKAANANTGASTLKTAGSGGTAKNITRRDQTALQVGDIPSGSICLVEYDGTQWQLLSSTLPSTGVATFLYSQTSGGNTWESLTATTWTQRYLNASTISLSGASLSANQITLPAGTYAFSASAPAYSGSAVTFSTRLRNTTAGATLAVSQTYRGTGSASGGTFAFGGINSFSGTFTLSVSSVLEIDTYSTAGAAGGWTITSGENEIGAIITVQKVA